MTLLKNSVDDALQNPEEHLEVAEVSKEVERVADHFRKINFFIQDYKERLMLLKGIIKKESAAKASGAPEAEEFAAKASGAAPSTPKHTRVHPINDEIPQQGSNAPQRGNKRRKEY